MELDIQNCSLSWIELPLEQDIYNKYETWLTEKERTFAQKRRSEYLAGRICAQKALADLGVQVGCLKKLSDGQADFPNKTCGSISHNDSLSIAVVSRFYKSIGIDVEEVISNKRLESILKAFVFDSEYELLDRDKELNATIIFSAKESLYKAIRPLCGIFFGFEQARILSINKASFEIEIKSEIPELQHYLGIYTGEWTNINGNIVTWVLINA